MWELNSCTNSQRLALGQRRPDESTMILKAWKMKKQTSLKGED